MLDNLLIKWHATFGPELPDVSVRSPGRVNIIGEHTDYNEGWVMPGAIDHAVYLLIRKNQKDVHQWRSIDFNESWQGSVTFQDDAGAPLWSKYLKGAIQLFSLEKGGLDILFGGDLPIGAGVSSSSAMVCGMLLGLQQIAGTHFTKEELAIMASRVEREVIGLQGGIMDQYAIMLSQRDHVMMLDCRDRSYSFIPAFIPGTQWILLNTKVKHQLIDSDYNQRAAECIQAVKQLKISYNQIKSLRDMTLDMLTTSDLPEVARRRVKFIIEENDRVDSMQQALLQKDPIQAGKLLQQSHHGLQYEYEVSCDESDHLANLANHSDGVYGGRMMGGGFGGCVICLVADHAVDQFVKTVSYSYQRQFGFEPDAIFFNLSDGAAVMT